MSVVKRLRAVGLVLAGVTVACGGAKEPYPTGLADLAAQADASTERPVIRLYDNEPSPGQIIVEAGTLVEWHNLGANDHTVTNYSQDQQWDDTLVPPGESFVHMFGEPGDYGFICIIHQEVGYVSVVEGSMDMDDMDMHMDDMDMDMMP